MESLALLKVAELRERLEAIGLPTNGLKADLLDRLRVHMEQGSTQEGAVAPADAVLEEPVKSDEPSMEESAAAVDSESPKDHEEQQQQDSAVAEKSDDVEMQAEESAADSKPSASELARKRAERFGIPVVAVDAAAAPSSEEQKPAEDATVEDAPKTEGNERAPKESFDKYQPLIGAGIPEGSIIESADFVIDMANLRRIEKVIELEGEEKVKESVKDVCNRIDKEFEGERSKIRAPSRLATSRLSFVLKGILARLERKDRDWPRNDKGYESKKDDSKGGKWTDEEWEQWKKNKGGETSKKDDWKSSSNKKDDWKDWKSGSGNKKWDDKKWDDKKWDDKKWDDKKWDNKKWDDKKWDDKKWDDKKWDDKKSYKAPAEDDFESDVEEFISSNKLDRRAAEAMRTESRGMVTYVMDQGFRIKNENTSKEVIMRMHEYRKAKERGGLPAPRSVGRSRSPVGHSKNRDRSYSRDRSDSRGRSRSRSYSRDRYARGSRSYSR